MGRAAPAATLALAAALVAAVPAAPADARPPMLEFETWCRDAAVVVRARAVSVEDSRVQFEALGALKGTLADRAFHATPAVRHGCIRLPDPAPFPEGIEVILFLAPPADGVHPVLDGGQAWLAVNDRGRAEVVAAVRRAIDIASIESPEARLDAWFAALEDGNAVLRLAARRVVFAEFRVREKVAAHEDRLVALLRSEVLEARMAALDALRHSKSEKALPILLELLDDEVKPVRENASMALAPYDTEVTVRALVAAARRPEMLERVIIDLRGSRRPEARAALLVCLHSEDPKIRELAARSFYQAVFEGDAVIAELHRMTADPDLAVRAAALHALHKSPLPETVGVLLGVLRREGIDPKERRNAVVSLGVVVGTIRHPKEIRQALRDAADLPRLMEAALRAPAERNLPPLGHAAVQILSVAWTAEAHALLVRARDGEFGEEIAEPAKRALERASREKR